MQVQKKNIIIKSILFCIINSNSEFQKLYAHGAPPLKAWPLVHGNHVMASVHRYVDIFLEKY